MPGSSGIDFFMFVLLIPFNVIMLRCRFAACEFVRGGLFPRRPPARLNRRRATGAAAGRGLVDAEVKVDGRADPPGAYHREQPAALIGAV